MNYMFNKAKIQINNQIQYLYCQLISLINMYLNFLNLNSILRAIIKRNYLLFLILVKAFEFVINFFLKIIHRIKKIN